MMDDSMRRTACIFGLICALGFGVARTRGAGAPAAAPSASDLEFYEKRGRPLLMERCYQCHSQQAKKLEGNLLLDSPQGWLAGGDLGPALVPGDPEKSLLIEAVRYGNQDLGMPPKKKLAQTEIDLLVEWVKRGAPATRSLAGMAPSGKRTIDLEAERRFWSYQPIRRPALPAVKDTARARDDIHRF